MVLWLMIKILSAVRRIGTGAFLALSLMIAGSAHAQDNGDPIAGKRLAQAWCANCHVVDDKQQATSTGAPTFAAVAANRDITPLGLRVFFQSPHVRMPDLHLSNVEMDHLIAYIMALRGK